MHLRNDESSATEPSILRQIDPGEEARLYRVILERSGDQHTLAELIAVRRASPDPVWGIMMQPDQEYWDIVQSSIDDILPDADTLVLQATEGETWNMIDPPAKQGTVYHIDQQPFWELDVHEVQGQYKFVSADESIFISFDFSSPYGTIYWTFAQTLNIVDLAKDGRLTLKRITDSGNINGYNAATSRLRPA